MRASAVVYQHVLEELPALKLQDRLNGTGSASSRNRHVHLAISQPPLPETCVWSPTDPLLSCPAPAPPPAPPPVAAAPAAASPPAAAPPPSEPPALAPSSKLPLPADSSPRRAGISLTRTPRAADLLARWLHEESQLRETFKRLEKGGSAMPRAQPRQHVEEDEVVAQREENQHQHKERRVTLLAERIAHRVRGSSARASREPVKPRAAGAVHPKLTKRLEMRRRQLSALLHTCGDSIEHAEIAAQMRRADAAWCKSAAAAKAAPQHEPPEQPPEQLPEQPPELPPEQPPEKPTSAVEAEEEEEEEEEGSRRRRQRLAQVGSGSGGASGAKSCDGQTHLRPVGGKGGAGGRSQSVGLPFGAAEDPVGGSAGEGEREEVCVTDGCWELGPPLWEEYRVWKQSDAADGEHASTLPHEHATEARRPAPPERARGGVQARPRRGGGKSTSGASGATATGLASGTGGTGLVEAYCDERASELLERVVSADGLAAYQSAGGRGSYGAANCAEERALGGTLLETLELAALTMWMGQNGDAQQVKPKMERLKAAVTPPTSAAGGVAASGASPAPRTYGGAFGFGIASDKAMEKLEQEVISGAAGNGGAGTSSSQQCSQFYVGQPSKQRSALAANGVHPGGHHHPAPSTVEHASLY